MKWRFESDALGANCIVNEHDEVVADNVKDQRHGNIMSASPDMFHALLLVLNVGESEGHDMQCSELLKRFPSIKRAAEKALGK